MKLAYEDDRKEKRRRDELEKQIREARAAAAANRPAAVPSASQSPTKASPISVAAEADQNDGGDDKYQEDSEELMSMFPSQPRMQLRGGNIVDEAPASTN